MIVTRLASWLAGYLEEYKTFPEKTCQSWLFGKNSAILRPIADSVCDDLNLFTAPTPLNIS
jgi:hypothetical protein